MQKTHSCCAWGEKSREGAAALVVLRRSLAEAVPAEGPGGPSVAGTRSGCCEGQGAELWGWSCSHSDRTLPREPLPAPPGKAGDTDSSAVQLLVFPSLLPS